jgi:hypothetical protein
MEVVPPGRDDFHDGDAHGNYQAGFWVDESLRPVRTENERAFVSGIAIFLRTNQVAALELYQSPTQRKQNGGIMAAIAMG